MQPCERKLTVTNLTKVQISGATRQLRLGRMVMMPWRKSGKHFGNGEAMSEEHSF